MSEKNQNNYQDDEITLKELILRLKEFNREIIKNWKWVFLMVTVMISVFLYRAITTPSTYTAKITFMVNEDGGGGNAGVGAILGQFGFGGGGSGDYNLDKIVELSKSMRIIREVLFSIGSVNDENDFYANHLIRLYNFHEKWIEDPSGLEGFMFTKGNPEQFDRTERKAMKAVYIKIRGDENIEGLMSIDYQEETGILNMVVKSESEDFSIGFVNTLFDRVSQFYIKQSTEKPKMTYQKLKIKTDSLKQALDIKEYQLAKGIDSNIGLVSKSAQLKLDQLRRDVQILTMAYGKTLENKEIAEFTLNNATPAFQVVDIPISPIQPQVESKLKAIIIGGILGGFLAVIFLIGRKIYRDALV